MSDSVKQRQRRVFWETYCLDRFSSATLGRPFAIDDKIITAEFATAIPITDEDPLHHDPYLVQHGWPSYAEASDRTVFDHLLTLSRITSSLHASEQSKHRKQNEREGTRKPQSHGPGAEDSFQMLCKLRSDLETWRRNAPRYNNPQCLYQSPRYFELCFHSEKLYLIRLAIDRIPQTSSLPPGYLLRPCLSTAYNVIRTFNDLRLNNLVPYTRAYTHLIFTTSLIVVFLSFAQVHPHYQRQNSNTSSTSQVDVDSWWAGLLDEGEIPTQRDSLNVLSTAGEVLEWLGQNMQDMRPYARFLQVLRRELSKEINKASGQNTNRSTNSTRQTPTSDCPPQTHDAPEHAPMDTQTYDMAAIPTQPETYDPSGVPFGVGMGLNEQGVSPDGILVNFFPFHELLDEDSGGFQQINASWPFSQMPWMESINSDLSGFDRDANIP